MTDHCGMAIIKNLEAIRNVALEHNLPFWNIVLSNAIFCTPNLLQQVFGFSCTLLLLMVHAASVISRISPLKPVITAWRPLTNLITKTPTWDMLRDVNLQLHKLGPTYITLKNINVFHHPYIPEGCSALIQAFISRMSKATSCLLVNLKDRNNSPLYL